MSTTRPPLSAYIITYNCAHEIERALQSIAWVDEIVCVDALSTDGTPDICARYGARVFSRPWEGFYPQLHFAEAQCTHDWALRLDADETVSPQLREEIQALFQARPAADGYKMRRRNYLHKRWIATAGYYPSWHLRLFRRSQGGTIPRKIHEKIKVKGRVAKLRGAIDHWCWANDGEMLENFLNYARIEAEAMTEENRRVRLHHFWLPAGNFLRRFFLRGGWRQGTFGAVVSARHACEQAVRLMLAWEMQNREWLETPDATWRSAQLPPLPAEPERERAEQP